MNFWKDGLSVDESKFSVIVLILMVGFGYLLYRDFTNQAISPLLADILKSCLYAIAGINVADSVSSIFAPTEPTRLTLSPELTKEESTI